MEVVSVNEAEPDRLKNQLQRRKVCRFCVSADAAKLSSIFTRDPRIKASAPLTLQAMGITSTEIFDGDGLPLYVCVDCRIIMEFAFRFKRMCKSAENLLRQYPLTGIMPEPLEKPCIPTIAMPKQQKLQQQAQPKPQIISGVIDTTPNANVVAIKKKLLNANPAEAPEPPAPVRNTKKRSRLADETQILLDKFENNEEISMEDVQLLVEAGNNSEDDYSLLNTTLTPSPKKLAKKQTTTVELSQQQQQQTPTTPTTPTAKKPRLLNKSSIRILNKEADVVQEPRLSQPKIEQDEDGNIAIVSEILDPSLPYEPEPDPTQDAVPLETNIFPCKHCERTFPLEQLRDIHMKQHMRARTFICKLCNKGFFSKYDLNKHELTHSRLKPFKCEICDHSFTRASLLDRHEKSHTEIPKYICVYCEKPFISEETLQKHVEHHQKERRFKCKDCDKAFAFKQGLERHETVHSKEQPHLCQYCGNGYSTVSKLARHLTAHAGKRPYPCKYCGNSYMLSHHLTRHLRSHKQTFSTFKCSVCTETFNKREDLINHSIVHSTQTLCCSLCKEQFQELPALQSHLQLHTNSDIFACEYCDLIFMSANRLQAHTHADHFEEFETVNMLEHDAQDKKNVKSANSTLDEFLIYIPTANADDEELITSDVISPKVKSSIKQERVAHNQEEFIAVTQQKQQQKQQQKEQEVGSKVKIIENVVVPKSAKVIDTVLKALPKCVSVRRKSTADGMLIKTTKENQKSVSEPVLTQRSYAVNTA